MWISFCTPTTRFHVFSVADILSKSSLTGLSLIITGEVLLDKVSKVETVVNKTNAIDNTYRNFAMEVLAGKPDFVTTAKENGHSFKMDFSKVYWNPRLSMCLHF